MEGKKSQKVKKNGKEKRVKVGDGRKRRKKITKNMQRRRNKGVWVWEKMETKMNEGRRWKKEKKQY